MDKRVTIERITLEDMPRLRELMFDGDMEWKNYDGPYFPIKNYDKAHLQDFIQEKENYVTGKFSRKILFNGEMVGTCTAYYEDGDLKRWLEVGISLFDTGVWGRGIGYQALEQMVTLCFETTDLPRIGLTTWSGNTRMMALAAKLGLKEEGRIRKVRYWKGRYWDSMKYGILREEWAAR